MVKRIFSGGGWMLAAVAMALAGRAQAAVSYTGDVSVIEVWASGNVAFKLTGVSGTCANSDWFVLNKSADGVKNLYAALLSAKLAEKSIRIYSTGCAPADGYGPTPYLQVSYLYIS